MYFGRSFKARLTAKIGVVFEKRKFAAKIGEFRVEVLLADELDEGLDRIDVRGDKLARLDHRAVFQHHRRSLASLDENPLDAVGFDIIDAVVRHHVRQVVAERVRRAAAELRIDAPGDHRGNQISGLRRVELVAAHDAEKADESAHARMLEMIENEFLRRGVEIF